MVYCRLYSCWQQVRAITRPNIFSYCFCTLRLRLHGSGQIFARTNFVPGPHVYMDPCKFCWSGVHTDPWQQSLDQSRYLIPGHNRTIWAKRCTVRGFTGACTNMEPCRSKSWPAFFRSQTCTLSRSKICPVPPVPCKCKVEPCKFLSVQRFVRTRINGAQASLKKFLKGKSDAYKQLICIMQCAHSSPSLCFQLSRHIFILLSLISW